MEKVQGGWKGIGERESDRYRGEGNGRGTGEREIDRGEGEGEGRRILESDRHRGNGEGQGRRKAIGEGKRWEIEREMDRGDFRIEH